jgi:hypothetical protein
MTAFTLYISNSGRLYGSEDGIMTMMSVGGVVKTYPAGPACDHCGMAKTDHAGGRCLTSPTLYCVNWSYLNGFTWVKIRTGRIAS